MTAPRFRSTAGISARPRLATPTIDRATFEQVRHVALHMRQRDFIEFAATSPFDTRAGLADALADESLNFGGGGGGGAGCEFLGHGFRETTVGFVGQCPRKLSTLT